MAEVLIVVAIIVILAGVGFVALFSHMRTMHQLEMDNQAKEIFVAAQNHLSLAESQGYLGKTYFGTDTETKNADGKNLEVYYLLVNGAADLSQDGSILGDMLPRASMDESARTGGSYIIRYQKSPAIVLDVFYADPSSTRYAHKLSAKDYTTLMTEAYYGSGDAAKKNRRTYSANDAKDAVIGWYGGESAKDIPTIEPLKAPYVEIINDEASLRVVIQDSNGDNTNYLRMYVEGDESKAKTDTINLKDSSAWPANRVTSEASGSYEIILDNVLDCHFASLTPSEGSFRPGENITVHVEAGNTGVFVAPVSASDTDNSLFGANTKKEVNNKYTLEIKNFRHLLNLDAAVSNLYSGITNNLNEAQQTANLDWTSSETIKSNIKTFPVASEYTTATAGYFLPLQTTYQLTYNGQGHSITGLVVDTTKLANTGSTRNISNAGLFGVLSGSSKVYNLTLVDFNLDGSGSVGALAGYMEDAVIEGILVRNSTATTSGTTSLDPATKAILGAGATGGLVGSAKNGTIQECAAAVYVQSSSGSAGGLVGTTDGTTVMKSYSGGHTEGKVYRDNAETGPGRWNVMAKTGSKFAGGLVGESSGGAITYCYSTSSAYGDTAGGLVGKFTGTGSVTNCYATGLAKSSKASGGTAHPFISSGTPTTCSNNYYLLGITAVAAGTTRSNRSLTSGSCPSKQEPTPGLFGRWPVICFCGFLWRT